MSTGSYRGSRVPRLLVAPIPLRACLQISLLALVFIVLSLEDAISPANPEHDIVPKEGAGQSESTPADGVDVVIVPVASPWLLAVATPVVERLQRNHVAPTLIAVDIPPSPMIEKLLMQIVPRRTLILAPERDYESISRILPSSGDILPMAESPLRDSLRLASQFWTNPQGAVVASLDEPAAVILGAVLAAHRSWPILVVDSDNEPLSDAIHQLHPGQVVVSTSFPDVWQTRCGSLGCPVTVLSLEDVQTKLIETLQPSKVRNAVLTRVPSVQDYRGLTAWLAPYLSWSRHSAVVFSGSEEATDAEAAVSRLVGTHGLRLSTVTILADYVSIGRTMVRIPIEGAAEETHSDGEESPDDTVETHYDVPIEPCMPTDYREAATMGVGRIPFESLEDASILVARGLVRDRVLLGKEQRLLMVANPNRDSLALPMCETISRVTANEFKNAGIAVDEFYRMPSDDPETLAASCRANLIIYQGHLYHQQMFPTLEYLDEENWDYRETGPEFDHHRDRDYYDQAPGWYPEQSEDREMAPEVPDGGTSDVGPDRPWLLRALDGVRPGVGVSTILFPDGTEMFQPRLFSQTPMVPDVAFYDTTAQMAGEPISPPDRPLDGMPVVVLQSCDSLGQDVWYQIHASGGVALVGSVSHIHSASGSAMIKAVSDGLLYRGQTLGEAIRDARNYFFCLQDLKNRRQHTQQAKSQRVALSFQLWGDPELRVFPCDMPSPRITPIRAEWVASDAFSVTVPRRRLETASTEKYIARVFPGSQVAGLVKRLKNKSARRLTPTYFFRLPMPDNFQISEFATLTRPENNQPNRSSFLIDPAGRFLYVLYYPDEEKPNETFTLRFEN